MNRCKWCNEKNPLYVKYHDEEWGVLRTDDKYLYEMLILESFQAGLSWECVLNKRECFREAFDDFDIDKISNYGDTKIAELSQNSKIIRNKLKIKATITNSKVFKDIVNEHGTFYDYLCTFTNGRIYYETELTHSPLSDSISADLIKRGMKFCGSVIIYSYLQAIGIINSHDKNCVLHGEADKQCVRAFFNSKATVWDSIAVDCSDKINRIMNTANISAGDVILDVACGTGILVPFYLERDVNEILGTDISDEMIKLAQEKFADNRNVSFIRADAEETSFPRKYNHAIVFDALPHFGNPIMLIKNLSKALLPKGRLTVAHSMGAKQLDELHKKAAPSVSRHLIPAQDLCEIMSKHFNVDTVISEDDFYMVSGTIK